VKHYAVVQRANLKELEEMVFSLNAEGWEPQGGVSAFVKQDIIYYLQAIVKETHNPVLEGSETDE